MKYMLNSHLCFVSTFCLRQDILIGVEACFGCFSSHFFLKYLHSIHSRIYHANRITLYNKCYSISVRNAENGTNILRDRNLSLGHNLGIICKNI